ncbi:hypothetical protein F5884DRAFT_798405 [Xylogone sp. PMI_703]|nr:hypothetical protein F5884DRAFT_798405 [Xylogone sp. PMI_703]
MIPTQRVIEILSIESAPWFCQLQIVTPSLRSRSSFTLLDIISTGKFLGSHPSVVARALMCIVICLQQLPGDFDGTRIGLTAGPKSAAESIVSAVSSLVTSDDEVIATSEGLESLVLQHLFYINSGKPRRAWLCIRRSLAIGQLMGLHNLNDSPMKTYLDAGNSIQLIWRLIIHSDRLFAVFFGFPYGIRDDHCISSADGPAVDFEDMLYLRQLDAISGRIIDRDQSSSILDFVVTQSIQSQLEDLAKSMPETWWIIPDAANNFGLDVANLHGRRLNIQIWHHQLELTLHLPFMLRSTMDRKYEYSRFCCLNASRELIKRYILIRNSSAIFYCGLTNFQAFVAVVILILNILTPCTTGNQNLSEHERSDWTLVAQVVDSLETSSSKFNDSVALHALNVLRVLQSVGLNPQSWSGNLRLTIPYFGTIYTTRRSSSKNLRIDKVSEWNEFHVPISNGRQEGLQELADYPSIYLTSANSAQSAPGVLDEVLQSYFSEVDHWSQAGSTSGTFEFDI